MVTKLRNEPLRQELLALTDCSFAGASCEQTNFYKTVAPGANFRGARLQNTSFKNAKLNNANFTEADLSGAKLWQPESQGPSVRNPFETEKCRTW
jgi:uncharacterized protein YjbI with pentapeptide repeats